MTCPALTQEWCLLQNQSDSYEKCSLFIKLVAIILTATLLMNAQLSLVLSGLLLVLWLQDAIWKTFQARINTRLLQLEEALAQSSDSANTHAFQFNRQYLANRPSNFALIKEYISQALKPTVAFPYIILVILLLLSWCAVI